MISHFGLVVSRSVQLMMQGNFSLLPGGGPSAFRDIPPAAGPEHHPATDEVQGEGGQQQHSLRSQDLHQAQRHQTSSLL